MVAAVTGIRRARVVAALGLVVALGAAWLVTSRPGETRSSAAAATTTGGVSTTPPPVAGSSERLRSLAAGRRARCMPVSGSDLRCRVGGVQVDYRLVPVAALESVYRRRGR